MVVVGTSGGDDGGRTRVVVLVDDGIGASVGSGQEAGGVTVGSGYGSPMRPDSPHAFTQGTDPPWQQAQLHFIPAGSG
jgi:hypothetical protein